MKDLLNSVALTLAALSICESARTQTAYTWTTLADTNQIQISVPTGVTVDRQGDVFVLDSGTYTLKKLVRSGASWSVITIAGLAGASGTSDGTNSDIRFGSSPNGFDSIATDASGKLYITDSGNNTIRMLTQIGPDWVSTTIAGLAGNRGFADGTNSDSRFANASGVVVDKDGTLYVADSQNYAVRKIVPVGTNWVTTTLARGFGNADGTNSAIKFHAPYGITVDAAGNLYVADSGNNTIRQVVQIGADVVCTTIAGKPGSMGLFGTQDGTNSTIRFGLGSAGPRAVALGNAGQVLVADTFNNTMRLLTPVGTNWVSSTIGGLGAPVPHDLVDGIGTAARFYHPSGIALDKNANIYVSDADNHTIRVGQPIPSLRLVSSTDQLVCSWSSMFSNFVLETSSTLAPATTWTPLTNGLSLSEGEFVVTNTITMPAAFFRLHQRP